MKKRELGMSGLEVSALGLGCMNIAWAYGRCRAHERRKSFSRFTTSAQIWDRARLAGTACHP